MEANTCTYPLCWHFWSRVSN